MRAVLRYLLTLLVAALCSHAAVAQSYPDRAIRWIVPWPVGGGADVVARLFSDKVAEELGQPVVIINQGGAGGNIGARAAADAKPDGYTIVFAYSGTHSINPHIYKKMPFKQSDFSSVIFLTSVPQMLTVNAGVPAKTVQELIELAKKSETPLKFGSSGNGAINHLAGELFASTAGIKLMHVPYKGGGPAAMALLGGEIDMIFGEPSTFLANIQAGKLRAVATTSKERSLSLPEIPTIAESGLPGYDVTSWNGVLAPAGTPPEAIARLNEAFNNVLKDPDMRKRLLDNGYEPVGGKPEDFDKHIQAELDKWGPLVKQIGLQID
ncbi:MAG: tripartite tricarboxylate transporter substrate binding protein [Candidimonas sp.]|jgi:tripartite-type tricarboxylate transporter receptor subunit TctC